MRVAYRHRLLVFFRKEQHLMTYRIDDAQNEWVLCPAFEPVRSAADLAERLHGRGAISVSGPKLGDLRRV